MNTTFLIEDSGHAEQIGEYTSLVDAWNRIIELSKIPWDEVPNIAPCSSWNTCGREYEIIEYQNDKLPWVEIRRIMALKIFKNETIIFTIPIEHDKLSAQQSDASEPASPAG